LWWVSRENSNTRNDVLFKSHFAALADTLKTKKTDYLTRIWCAAPMEAPWSRLHTIMFTVISRTWFSIHIHGMEPLLVQISHKCSLNWIQIWAVLVISPCCCYRFMLLCHLKYAKPLTQPDQEHTSWVYIVTSALKVISVQHESIGLSTSMSGGEVVNCQSLW
jgi:hypothetical protein